MAVEQALRWLATHKGSVPLALLREALEEPGGDADARLQALVAPTASLPGGAVEVRAQAAWGLIVDSISRIGSMESRRRRVLLAAFRLSLGDGTPVDWKPSLDARFEQLRRMEEASGRSGSRTVSPMHKEWRRSLVEKLSPVLHERLSQLAGDGRLWSHYVALAREVESQSEYGLSTGLTVGSPSGYRAPSEGAQPVFVDLFVTTVFMEKRSVYRRITERLVTAREDGVDSYLATSLAGKSDDISGVPVRDLWGCRAEPLRSPPGEPSLTLLRFPRALKRGESHWFSSEAIDSNTKEERLWVNVEVDHHGIAPGRLHQSQVPVAGLTIRIKFQEGYLPESCWWYAEQTERERRIRPPDGDPRLIPVTDDSVQHTFGQRCHPRESYGIALRWPGSVDGHVH
ncbi:hypothetical protein [Amycolatopsis sacchari]|uniref:hypothetical protein n=1 Tax=Amycolatopsis sacchari TaxID=115433 RepID=UPI001FE5079C|nr:hypothetical protein [Amycolatopsis sacchari]